MRQVLTVWLVHLVVFAFAVAPAIHSPVTLAFAGLAILAQSSLFCLPMLVLATLSSHRRGGGIPQALSASARLALPLVGVVLLILLYSNYSLASRYGFFIDPFVWNLLTTPGGTAALGATSSFYLTIALSVIVMVSFYAIAVRTVPVEKLLGVLAGRPAQTCAALFVLLLVQGTVHAVAEYKSYVPVLAVSDRIPWYPAFTAKSLLAAMGVKPSRQIADVEKNTGNELFNYHHSATQLLPLEHRHNIVWLVAESWRWDMLNPEIMPATWEFARHSQRFTRHYSTGNGTRMGIFGQFYGLNGRFWFPALRYQRSPLLIDVLQSSGYQVQAYTSASFSYPEFDKTVWLNVPDTQLTSRREGPSWERDRENVTDLIEFTRTATRPFLAFMFFEATHANYNFPPANAIRKDYIDNFDYLATDISAEMPRIKNRYINASSYLDSQFRRVFSALQAQGRLDDTIVIVTGDHGEEFLENGRWGHNSTFSQQQIRVPLIVRIPGQPGRSYAGMTSHLDIPATVLAALKPGGPADGIGMGSDLLSPSFSRDFTVVSDWHGDALITEGYKLSMSAKANARGNALSSQQDERMEQDGLPPEMAAALAHYLSESASFRHRQSAPATAGVGGIPIPDHGKSG